MQHFSDIDSIRSATVEELSQIPGIPESTASKIYNFFHQDSNNDTTNYEG
jgi:excinuclease ABC subunit C